MLADGDHRLPARARTRRWRESYAAWSARHFGWAPDAGGGAPGGRRDGRGAARDRRAQRSRAEWSSRPRATTPSSASRPSPAARSYLLDVPASADRAEIDLDRLDRLFADGAQTLILTQPHNPWGRVFTRAELEGIRDVVVRHGARVVSDEIHAPLVLPGAEHVSYLSIDGTHDHAVAVVAASKAFNTAGLRCAQLVVPVGRRPRAPRRRADVAQRLVVAARRRRRAGGVRPRRPVARLPRRAARPAARAARRAPRRAPPRGADAPARGDLPRLARRLRLRPRRRRGRRPRARPRAGQPGASYAPGSTGQVRLNIATSPDRLTEIVERLAKAWT